MQVKEEELNLDVTFFSVILTVASEDLQFKGWHPGFQAALTGSGVYLWVSTDVRSNFCTVFTVTAPACRVKETSTGNTHRYLLGCFGVASVNDLCFVSLTSTWNKCWLKTTRLRLVTWTVVNLRSRWKSRYDVPCAERESYNRSSSCAAVPSWACRESSKVDYVSADCSQPRAILGNTALK